MEWLATEYQIPSSDFYALKRSERAKLIKDTVKQDEYIAKWQRKHWQAETGYSFLLVICYLRLAGHCF